MTFVLFVQKFFVYGCLGILIEFFFTGLSSLIKRHWKATGNSYLWMCPVYGFTALMLEALHEALPWPFYLRALVYVPLIYGVEALSGWTLEKLTGLLQRWFGGSGGGTIPWEYNKSAWAPMGLINLKYSPYWLLLALGFDPLSVWLHRVLVFLAKME
jgi:uncharacterized membrane protein